MTILNDPFGSQSSPSVNDHKDSRKISSNEASEANKGIGTWGQYVAAPVTYLGHSYSYLFNRNNNSAAIDKDGKSASVVGEEIGAWRQYVVAPATYLSNGYGYLFNSAAVEKDTEKSIVSEVVDANRGISAAILLPWRQYVVASNKYLSNSTQFAVIDAYKKTWLFRLDTAHVKGAKYPHMNVNYALTGVPDPHTRIPGALVSVSGPVGKVMRNAGDIVTIAAVTADIYKIGSTAYTEQKETGGVGAETAKVAAGVGGAWTGGFLCAAVGGKMGSVAGGVLAGPVGAGVGGIVGAVAGGIGGSIKGRSGCEHLVEQQTQTKCKL